MLSNIIYVEKKEFLDELAKLFVMDVQEEGGYFYASSDDKSLVLYNGGLPLFQEFLDNYQVLRLVYFGRIFALGTATYSEGDFIVPNTYISENKDPIFNEYAVGDSFNLEKFKVHFYGVVGQLHQKDMNHDSILDLEEEGVDLYQGEVYDFFEKYEKMYNEEIVGIFFIGEQMPVFTKNIIELMTSEDE